jgi:hypothetical protein
MKCKNTRFELHESRPAGAKSPIQFVQCAKCGTPVGVLNFHTSIAESKDQEELLEKSEDYLKQGHHSAANFTNVLKR